MSQVMNLSLVTGPANLIVRRRAVGSIPAMVMLGREGSVGRWSWVVCCSQLLRPSSSVVKNAWF